MCEQINRSVSDTGLPEILEKFGNIVNSVDDRELLKLYLFQVAYDAVICAIRQNYYELKDLTEYPNYSEICEWCGWPDLQDNGIFEQAIDAAWNVVRYANDIVPLEVMPYVKKHGRLSDVKL